MNLRSKTLYAALLLAALVPLNGTALAQGAAPTQTPTQEPAAGVSQASSKTDAAKAPAAPEAPLHELAPSKAPEPLLAPDAAPKHHHHSDRDDMVAVFGSLDVLEDEHCEGNAVAVMGNAAVHGEVDGNAVVVMGTNTINGTVHGNAVAVMGTLKLGPKAHVDGNAVSVSGRIERDPAAFICGQVVDQAGPVDLQRHPGASAWWEHGFLRGRPLAIGPHLHLIWIVTLLTAGLYVLLALVFPAGVTRCADVIVDRPGLTFLVGVLSILALPLLFVVLLITIIGIPVAVLVMPMAVFSAILFGKAGVYALVGRAFTGRQVRPALWVVVGVSLFILIYLVPLIGFLSWMLVAWLGYSCALTALFTLGSNRGTGQPPGAAAPAGAPAPAAAPSGNPTAAALVAGGVEALATPAPADPLATPGGAPAADAAVTPPVIPSPVIPPPVVPPPVITPPAAAPASPAAHTPETALPRAGFWIRVAALAIDSVIVGIVIRSSDGFLPVLAVYGALLWKLRGATVGDIILGLKVVRHDGRVFDWTTSVVRALACFVSLIFVGLGFIWIAFDTEKQAWHDKIAGTIVVRLPKGVSLV